MTCPDRIVRPSAALLVATLLAGCASDPGLREAQDLARHGQWSQAHERLEEAHRLDPGSVPVRAALLQVRARQQAELLERAERHRREGRLDDAERDFRALLALHPTHERAQSGLQSVDRDRRAALAFAQARAAVAAQDTAAARTRLRSLLLAQPGHAGAKALLLQLDEQAPPAQATPMAMALRKPITIEFKDVPLRTVFEVISRTSGLNFLFDKDVRTDQKTSIFLRNSTIEAAVALTLLTNQLEQRVLDGHSVLVYPNTAAKQKDYQPLRMRSFYLANAEAKTVGAALKTLVKTRDIVVDDKLNMIIMRDTPEAVRLAEKVVALHDVPEPEVMLEVEILEVKRTRLLDLGIRWPDQLTLTPLAAQAGNALTVDDLRALEGSRIGATVSPLTVNARKTDTEANILANPRIRARNREKARILIGERVPNITATSSATGFVAESVNYVDVGLKLDVEPTIYLEGDVAIKVSLEVSNIISQLQTKSGSIAYQIGTRTAQTVLRLKDGENQVLAGLINDEDRRSGNRVPGLGEVPVLGRLFGSQADDASKTEIVLSITPRVVRHLQPVDASLMEFESGTEHKLGAGVGEGEAAGSTLASPAVVPAAGAAATPVTVPAALPASGAPPAATPRNPVAPIAPSAPVAPVAPTAPVAPVAPIAPVPPAARPTPPISPGSTRPAVSAAAPVVAELPLSLRSSASLSWSRSPPSAHPATALETRAGQLVAQPGRW